MGRFKIAMSQLSFIAHAYIWGDIKPHGTLPEALANPGLVSKHQGRPLISYASYCLDNWFLINQDEEISLENVGLIITFLAELMKIGL